MLLEKYGDFLNSTTKQLSNFLAVTVLNTSGRKAESVTSVFAAVELKLDISKTRNN